MTRVGSWLGATAGVVGRALMGAGVWVVSRRRIPGRNYLTTALECDRLAQRAAALLREYKELGDGGVTAAEGKRMEEIVAELRAIGDAWNAIGCRYLAQIVAQGETVPAELAGILAPPS